MQKTIKINKEQQLLGFAFLFSGAAGLIYQVAWQRILFASFGVDLVSVCIIVSTFMLGLGCGALLGGQAADRWPEYAIAIFSTCEALVGLFGIASPHLIRAVAELLGTASIGISALANFLLVLPPTILMGATLPVLVAHFVRGWKNTGAATGFLYSINTIGAMFGAFATGFWLFNFIELDQVIYLAAVINITVALLIFVYSKSKQ